MAEMTALERQEARHKAALERIAAEDAEREARKAAMETARQDGKNSIGRQAECGTPSGYQPAPPGG